MKKTILYALIMAASTSAAVALADDHGGDDDKKERPHGPPIEALKACEGKTAGAKVQFENRNGRTINGTCKLIAVPERLKGEKNDDDDRPREQGSQGQGVK